VNAAELALHDRADRREERRDRVDLRDRALEDDRVVAVVRLGDERRVRPERAARRAKRALLRRADDVADPVRPTAQDHDALATVRHAGESLEQLAVANALQLVSCHPCSLRERGCCAAHVCGVNSNSGGK